MIYWNWIQRDLGFRKWRSSSNLTRRSKCSKNHLVTTLSQTSCSQAGKLHACTHNQFHHPIPSAGTIHPLRHTALHLSIQIHSPQHSLFLLKSTSNSEGLFTIEVPYPPHPTQEVNPILNSSTLAKSTSPHKGNECSVRLKAPSAGMVPSSKRAPLSVSKPLYGNTNVWSPSKSAFSKLKVVAH